MNRDEFVEGANAGPATCGEGRQAFVVVIDSEHHTVERSLRRALLDHFGSLALAVKRLERPSCDMTIGEHPKAS